MGLYETLHLNGDYSTPRAIDSSLASYSESKRTNEMLNLTSRNIMPENYGIEGFVRNMENGVRDDAYLLTDLGKRVNNYVINKSVGLYNRTKKLLDALNPKHKEFNEILLQYK